MDRKTNKQIIVELKQFLSKIKKDYKIEKAILFGSRARGDYLNSSDVDLIIVSDDFKNINIKKRSTNLFDYWNEDVDIQILCYTKKEFEKMKKQLGIVNQAIKEGILIN